ncbi:MAG: hypothetical protein GTO55_02685 [Armatimonadetes bacterium]|nr:hypothetical protein [Armatimonadota bacterium]NIM23186.1 hypothetical protein [Armatimonadota bacterium]NIM67054.1 hypothetical protein [Armatimonadota bacterium]NIM75588.1 hypothetical protein [Armatimonadota bacterium]NIN05243.1 hypothetical protein [Armatimonadota bacterium]
MALQPRNWRKPIGEILVEKELVTRAQLEEALVLQRRQPGKKIGEVLVKLGYVDKKDVLRAHAEQLGMMYETGVDTD